MPDTIPPPPDETTLYGGSSSNVPPPPSEADLYHVPAAQRVNAQGQHPNALQAGIMDLTNNPMWKDLVGGYQSASLNGFGGLVARNLLADQGPVGDVTRSLAGVHGKPTQQQVLQATQQARQDAAQQVQQNAQNVHTPFGNVDPVALAGGFVGGADPTLAIPIPGVGGLAAKIGGRAFLPTAARVATRVAGNAAGHGVLGSASDAAYQGADMLDGLQQDFDVKRNLHSAELMAGFGGAMGGLHEATPFVQSLFKSRNGLDTTPSATPAGTTNPFSGQEGMTRDQLLQYHDVLQSGNESDIHNFFNDKNIVPPTHSDIHDWVQRRDAQPDRFNPVPDSRPTADELTNNMLGAPDLRQAVNDHIAQHTAGWKNAPDYEVINHTDDIQDPVVRQAAVRDGADNPDALGFVGPDNKVRIFASRIDSPETLNAVLYHESLGHFGLQQRFGDKLDTTLQTLMDRNVGQFGKDVDAWQKANPGAYNGDRVRAAEEVLANQSNNGAIKPSISDALTSSVRQFGRKMGLNLAYSDAEIRNILSMAHDAVINGKGRDVRANGFRQSPAYQAMDLSGNDTPTEGQNKFMFTGPKAKNFNEDSPLAYTAKDGITRNEIGDEHSSVNTFGIRENSKQMLDQVLDHPRLYQEYPSLRDMPVKGKDLGANGPLGFYDPEKHAITINTQARGDIHSTILHEVQHAIQGIENVPGIRDGTAQLSKTDYLSSPLEREARSTQARQDFGYQERLENMPKFMRRSDLAASKDYVANDLEGIYKALDEGYVKDTRSFEEIRRSALEAGFSPSQIKDLSDVGDISTKLWRLQAAANMADQKLTALNEKLDSPNWTMEDKANYLTTLADRNYLVQRVVGNRSEIARALAVSKAASSYSQSTMKKVAELLREQESGLADIATDDTKFFKLAQQIKQMLQNGNPQGAHALIAGVNKPYWEQYVNSFHFNAMLSALSTHVKAPIDMGTGILRDVFEKALAAPIGAVRVGVGKALGKNLEPGVSANELAMHTYGMAKSFMDMEVYKQMAKAAVNGEGGYVGPNGQFQPVHMMNQYGATSNPDLGPVLSLPSHLVAAQDLFFRSQGMNANMYSFAVRKAKAQLGPGASFDDINTLASSMAQNPSIEMINYAKDRTDRTLLLNNNPLNNFLTKMRTYGPNMSVGERIAAFTVNTLAPFIRVESNSLINRFVQRSPLAVLDPYTVKVIKAGGPEADIAMAKILYGTVALGMAWAGADKLTGELSKNPAKRQELEAGNELPNSVHEDGRYSQSSNLAMSLFPWDQHNASAQMVKSAKDAFESKGATPAQKMVGFKLAFESVLHDMADMSWMASTTPFTDALTSKDNMPTKVAQLVGDQAKTFVPNILSQTERLTDNKRDIRPNDPTDITATAVNDVKSAIPGLAQTLPTRYSVYGRPMETGATPEGIHNWVGKGNGLMETSDPTEKELNRLANLTKAAIVTPTPRSVHIQGFHDAVKLTPNQAEEFQMYAGQAIVQAVREQQQSGAWNSMSDVDRIQFVRSTQTQAKKAVREALIDKPGWLTDEQLSNLRNQLGGK